MNNCLGYIKQSLKANRFANAINSRIRVIQVKKSYHALNENYQNIASKQGITLTEETVDDLIKQKLKQSGIYVEPKSKGELRLFYIGANYDQDYGGIIQGLKKFGDVIPFECEPGRYGQVPTNITSRRAIDNGICLLNQIKTALLAGPVHAVIGQMWAYSMDSSVLKVIREMGIPVINICMDDRHSFLGDKVNGHWTGVKGLLGSLDLACTTAPECCQWYAVEECPAIFLPEASDPELFKPSDQPKLHDVSFVGVNYGVRKQIVNAIEKRGVSVTCFGGGWSNGIIDVNKIPELFARSRIVLGIGTIGHCSDFYSLKMRDFDGPMSGSLYLTHDNPDLHGLYRVGKEIITYRNARDCADKVVYYLAHRDEAETIARSGRKRAEKDHTWEKRFETVLHRIGLIEKCGCCV